MPTKEPADDRGVRVVGEIVFEFQEHEDGNWYSKIRPNIISTDIREIYKLGLICAVLQDTCKKKLGAIDTLIKTKQEITKIHNELVEEKQNAGSTDNAPVRNNTDDGIDIGGNDLSCPVVGDSKGHTKTKVVPDTEKYQTKLKGF